MPSLPFPQRLGVVNELGGKGEIGTMIKGPIIECEKCNKQYEIGVDEFKKSEPPSEEERPMGYEIFGLIAIFGI